MNLACIVGALFLVASVQTQAASPVIQSARSMTREEQERGKQVESQFRQRQGIPPSDSSTQESAVRIKVQSRENTIQSAYRAEFRERLNTVRKAWKAYRDLPRSFSSIEMRDESVLRRKTFRNLYAQLGIDYSRETFRLDPSADW